MINKLENPLRLAELSPLDTLIKIGLAKDKVFCDIGAGTGIFAFPAAELTGQTVYAVDVSAGMRQILNSKAMPSLIVESHIQSLPSSSCDIALLCTVLHEVEAQDEMCINLHRILKKGGTLAIIEFHKQQTSMGPPINRRISEEQVMSTFDNGFIFKERFVLGDNFYCLCFNTKIERGTED